MYTDNKIDVCLSEMQTQAGMLVSVSFLFKTWEHDVFSFQKPIIIYALVCILLRECTYFL